MVLYLDTGSDAEGRPRVLEDPFAIVDGDVVPEDGSQHLLSSYFWHEVLPPGAAPKSGVSVQGPRVAGHPAPPVLNIPTASRIDPYRMDHQIDGDLSLSMTLLPQSLSGAAPIGSGSWQLQIMPAQSGPPILALQGYGAVPSPLIVPAGWLHGRVAAGDTILVMLQRQNAYEILSGTYPIIAGTTARLRWRVRLVAP